MRAMLTFQYTDRDARSRSLDALARACRVLEAQPGITMKALARHARTDVETLARVLGPDLVAFARHSAHTPAPERRKTRAWTDARLREALRKAAVVLDGDVREARYRNLATRPGASAPSSQTIIRRFGSWNAALESAGVGTVQPLRTMTSGRWSCAPMWWRSSSLRRGRRRARSIGSGLRGARIVPLSRRSRRWGCGTRL
ncbi:homing endonuclease associated repeat-containing protein [Demequina litorisediminis]|uniref:homing endonuclease associated repeat-containing protein n=1 Tax=Demequina litorisediminis TaxID=1849022 RepID=UPI003D675AF1